MTKRLYEDSRDPVVFRRWIDTGSVIALFPDIPADNAGRFCQAYEHVGQHGNADYNGVIRRTRSLKPSDYKPLEDELTARGYKLRVIRNATWRHHAKRVARAAMTAD